MGERMKQVREKRDAWIREAECLADKRRVPLWKKPIFSCFVYRTEAGKIAIINTDGTDHQFTTNEEEEDDDCCK